MIGGGQHKGRSHHTEHHPKGHSSDHAAGGHALEHGHTSGHHTTQGNDTHHQKKKKHSRMGKRLEEQRSIDSSGSISQQSSFVDSLRGANLGPRSGNSSRVSSKSPRPTPATPAAARESTPLKGEEQVLQVRLISCKDLQDADSKGKDGEGEIGSSDPYVKLRIGAHEIQSVRHDNTLHPYFNEEHVMIWDGIAPLHVNVFDHDFHSADDPLGFLEVPLQELDFSSVVEGVVHLHDIPLQGVPKGTISLEVRWVGSLLKTEHVMQLRRSMVLCPKCGGKGQVILCCGAAAIHEFVVTFMIYRSLDTYLTPSFFLLFILDRLCEVISRVVNTLGMINEHFVSWDTGKVI